MPAYLVGTVRILDAERFAQYAAAIRGLAAEHGGEPLVAGLVTDVAEGDSPVGERVVVTRFPSVQQAKDYLASTAYQSAKTLRAGAAELELRVVEG
jgi:uncharacterized protein (DUF1330 family)